VSELRRDGVDDLERGLLVGRLGGRDREERPLHDHPRFMVDGLLVANGRGRLHQHCFFAHAIEVGERVVDDLDLVVFDLLLCLGVDLGELVLVASRHAALDVGC
jgi:hypothetical protein